jgi:hypothetical protein
MLKVQKKAGNTIKELLDGRYVENALSGKLTLRKNCLTFNYNNPKTCGTKLNFCVFPGGDKCYNMNEQMKVKCKDTIDDSKLEAWC